jgi:LPS O-antigen subunit length determinant protein (WzzB/FepE family)
MLSDQQAQHDGDIDLVGIGRTLVRRRAWIAMSIVGFLGVALLYLMIKSPAYEASVRLRIGQVAGAGLFEAGETLSLRLMVRHGQEIAEGVRRDRPFLNRATVSKGAPGVLELVVEADTANEAVRFLREIADSVGREHGEIRLANQRLIEQRLEDLLRQRSMLLKRDAEATALVDQLKGSAPVQASLILIDRGSLAEGLGRLEAEILNLSQKLAPPQTQATETLGDIVTPLRPSSPRPTLIIVLASLLGIVSGIVVALFADVFVRHSEKSKA